MTQPTSTDTAIWANNDRTKHISFAGHGSSVITCLIFSRGRIVSASDDHSIHVYSPATGELLKSLEGHEGGVWAIAAYNDTLVSGSTDRTVRVWNLSTGRCTHIFRGHTSTVRCISIVVPEWMDVGGQGGAITKEMWPKRPLIITGSRDHSLRVWNLPKTDDEDYGLSGWEDEEFEDVSRNSSFVGIKLLTLALL